MQKSVIISRLLAFTLILALLVPLCGCGNRSAYTLEVGIDLINDRGNVIFSENADGFLSEATGFAYGDVLTLSFGDQSLDVPIVYNYAEVDSGTPGLRVKSDGSEVIFFVNNGNFAGKYGMASFSEDADGNISVSPAEGMSYPLTFSLSVKEKEGYAKELLIRHLEKTDERADYPSLSDEEFANFRQVTAGGLHMLYRSASPIDAEENRNTYNDQALEAHGIRFALNLVDSEEEARSFEGYADSYYSTINACCIALDYTYESEGFKAKLGEGLRELSKNEGPYVIHCLQGKDRTGFVCAMLEALAGASYDEIIKDYMITYYNFYGVEPGTERYDLIAESNIVLAFKIAFDIEDVKSADLQAEAAEYLRESGLTADECSALLACLKG